MEDDSVWLDLASRRSGCRAAGGLSLTHRTSSDSMARRRGRLTNITCGWVICVALVVLSSTLVLCEADAGPTARTPDEAIDVPPSQIANDRLGDTKKQLEQWSQMTKDHLEIPSDQEIGANKIDPSRLEGEGVDRPLDQLGSKNEKLPSDKEHLADPPPATDVELHADWEAPMKPTEPASDTSANTIPRRQSNAQEPSKSDENQVKDGPSSKAQEGDKAEAPQQNSAQDAKSDKKDQGEESKVETQSEELQNSDAQSTLETADIPLEQSHDRTGVDATGDLDDSIPEVDTDKEPDPAEETATSENLADQSTPAESEKSTDQKAQTQALPRKIVETAEERGRRNHRKAMQDEQQQARKAEDSLIKDAVTHGNRAKTPDAESDSSKSEESKTESVLDVEIRELMRQAEQYRWGTKEVKPDYSRAFSLCESAAEKGSLDGINCLGEFFKHGLGRERDTEKAVKHFQDAASRGHAAAQRNLAFLYSSGHGVEQSTALAVLHLHFAAVSGDHEAQLAMGYRHMYGIGVPKNCQTAMEFYMPASEHVVKETHQNRAQPMIEKQALSTEGVKAKSVDLDEDVVNYYAYSAERGDASAQVALGQLYFMGARGLLQDQGEAFKWYLRAAEQGDANAMGHLGNMYAQGIHVEADNQTALGYFRRGVEKGNALALNGLGFMHMYGMGVPQSYDEAFKAFSKAAEQGNQEARFNLGALHVGGYGVPKDYAKAIYYFTLAANRGHMLALYNLAMMHHNGFGTPRSCPNAVQFIKSVAERGEWAARLQRGYKLYQAGDVDRALLTYAELMELGLDVAQANVAHIYDEERTALTRGRRAAALRAYELSAQQGNMAAELKIGDYYYHGWGAPASYRKAVAHYRAASEARIAQAMFNLGWMHEQGRGIARDRHLAKRFYDMAAEAAPEAVWPAGICLARLWLLGAAEAALEAADAAALALTLRFGRYGLRVPPSTVWLPWAAEYWDALLGAVLVGLLTIVLAVRSHLAVARHTRHV